MCLVEDCLIPTEFVLGAGHGVLGRPAGRGGQGRE